MGKHSKESLEQRKRVTAEEWVARLQVRFWRKVNKQPGQGPQGECWEWIASTHERGYPDRGRKHSRGYGCFGAVRPEFGFKTRRAHVFSYVIHHGPTNGFCVLHKCDNPPCVNPDHLFLGTQADNVRDAAVKGRFSVRHTARASVSAEAVQEIRNTPHTLRALSLKFGISQTHIWRIRKGLVKVYAEATA